MALFGPAAFAGAAVHNLDDLAGPIERWSVGLGLRRNPAGFAGRFICSSFRFLRGGCGVVRVVA
jgi:hypothetical protein